MSKVTSINRDMYLGEYCNPQDVTPIPEGLLFAVGILSTIGLPQLILSVYGGIITLVALAGVMTLGSVAGLLAYLYMPYQMPHCVEAETGVRSPPNRDSRMKKAA